MAQVGGEQRQFGFDIGASPIPSQQSIHGKTVPKVMNPWRLSFRGDDAAFLK
jgi:hypothetical protein